MILRVDAPYFRFKIVSLSLYLDKIAFESVAVLIAYDIENGRPLFEV